MLLLTESFRDSHFDFQTSRAHSIYQTQLSLFRQPSQRQQQQPPQPLSDTQQGTTAVTCPPRPPTPGRSRAAPGRQDGGPQHKLPRLPLPQRQRPGLRSGPARGGKATSACPIVNQVCMARLCGRRALHGPANGGRFTAALGARSATTSRRRRRASTAGPAPRAPRATASTAPPRSARGPPPLPGARGPQLGRQARTAQPSACRRPRVGAPELRVFAFARRSCPSRWRAARSSRSAWRASRPSSAASWRTSVRRAAARALQARLRSDSACSSLEFLCCIAVTAGLAAGCRRGRNWYATEKQTCERLRAINGAPC